MRKQMIIALVLTVLLIITVPPVTSADIENNGSFDTAETIPLPGTMTGTVNFTDEDDIYRAQVQKGETLYITLRPNATLGVNLYLYQMQGSGSSATFLEVAADHAPTIGVSEGVPRSVNYTCNSGQEDYWMYIWVGNYKGYGTYELQVTMVEQDDARTESDAGDTFTDATAIDDGTHTGFLANADDEDIYSIQLAKGDSIYVDLTPEDTISINLYLMRQFDNNGLPDWEEVDKDKRTGDEGRGEKRHVEYSLDSKENTTMMFIRLYRDQDLGNYTLKVHTDHQNDGGSGTDAPDSKVDSAPLQTSGEFLGFMKGLDTMDFYTTTITDREVFKMNITPEPTASIALTLYLDGSMISEDKARNPDHERGATRSVNYTMPRTHSNSTAVIKVLLDSGKGNYSMILTIVPKPLDNDPPVVILVEPEPGSLVKNKRENEFMGTATDFNEISRIEISMDQVTWTEVNLEGDLGEYTWNQTVRFPKRGNNTIYFRSVDDQGNEAITNNYVRFKRDKPSPGFEAIALVVALVIGLTVMGRRRK